MYKTLFILLLIPIITYCQKSTIGLHSKIYNTKTTAHKNIPGTKIYIIPPKGSIVKTNLIQVWDDNYFIDISIMLGRYYK